MLWLHLLACTCVADPSSAADPPSADPAPVAEPGTSLRFDRPFQDEHPVTNFFDHAPKEDDRVLKTDGRPTYGIKGHTGYDFGMPIGTELLAMADGVVVKAGDLGPKRCTGGNRVPDNVQVHIQHDAPDGRVFVARYQHLSQVDVTRGDRVTSGQVIALSGNTGCSSGPHLHFEINLDGAPFDPYGWTGTQPDPRASRGRPSEWLWRDGEAPELRRRAQGMPRGTDFGIHKMLGTDALRPVKGEWVEIAVRRDARKGRSLAGLTLQNRAGDTFALPNQTLAPGETLRVWTQSDAPGPGAVSWGRETEVWDDFGDCASLMNARGEQVAWLSFGRGRGRCTQDHGRKEPVSSED